MDLESFYNTRTVIHTHSDSAIKIILQSVNVTVVNNVLICLINATLNVCKLCYNIVNVG